MIGTDISLILAAALLVLLAMVLVAVGEAIGKVSRARVHEMVRDGVRGADRLQKVIADRARYVNVLLFVELAAATFAVVFVVAVCENLIAQPRWLGWVIAGGIMVVVWFVAIGVAPRTVGQQHADKIALRGARLARFLGALLGPVASLLIMAGNALTPGKGYRQGPFATQAELREIVDLAEADHVIEEDERQMIHSVFELGGTTAREVMVPRTEMVWIERHKKLRQGLSLALRSGFSRIPVVGENLDDVVGVLYLKDLARRSFERREAEQAERIEAVMRPVTFVPDSKPADELLREMQAARVHVAIVVDEFGGTSGLITIEDILEEIVGEIADEYDIGETPEVEEIGGHRWRVSARLPVDDLAALTGIDVSEDREGVETVTGLLGRRLGVVPIPGSHVDLGGYRLVAESAAGRRNRVGTVLVTPLEPSANADADDRSPSGPGASRASGSPAAPPRAGGSRDA